ncbi:hypothetical protein K530_50670 [Streptomyces noursei CCRC 11814]|nr:hypothetical protein K530_50670 [Streptomyces noursei CCRC 11814]
MIRSTAGPSAGDGRRLWAAVPGVHRAPAGVAVAVPGPYARCSATGPDPSDHPAPRPSAGTSTVAVAAITAIPAATGPNTARRSRSPRPPV